jgi:lysophospholipase L1-like esterase/pimeloyl-ACP methyl ester carboxylesterase
VFFIVTNLINLKIKILKIAYLFFCTLVFTFYSNSIFGQKKVNIACVGNGVTYGIGVENREKNNFPQQLQYLLGVNYKVEIFGVVNAPVLNSGINGYSKTAAFKKSHDFNPNIVFIELGLDEIKAADSSIISNITSTLDNFIQSYANLSSRPRIVLLLPLPIFLKDSSLFNNEFIKNKIIPKIQKLAYEKNLELLDLFSMFIDREDLFLDKVHPSSLGGTLISKRLYELVKLETDKRSPIFERIKEQKVMSSFYGYACADFTYKNRNCKVVSPKKVADGQPWIWRARFWGHEPQTDIALLERGFHLVYMDVAEMYGNEESVKLWNQFYDYMQNVGMAKKVVLEGMSRGGIYAYNWALQNATKVAAVYADAPVLDMKSWPGGLGKGLGSKNDWTIFKNVFILTEEQAKKFKNSPLDNAELIAKGGYPMLHVVGDADEVVPVDENTNPFEVRIKNAGGDITVIHKKGIGHHPHSLANPTPIVDFILKSTGYKTKFSIIPTPSAEYRSAAGWKEGTDWWVQNEEINQLLNAEKKLDIIFLGNSITQGIGGDRPSVTYKAGKPYFEKAFNEFRWVVAGISGDRTQHLLWRLQNGNYASSHPKLLVLTIGVNNFNEDSGEETADGIKLILDWLKVNMPQTKVLLIGPLPTGLHPNSSNRIKYDIVHSIIKNYKSPQVTYLPLTKYFIKQDGELDTNYCSGDGIHLIEPGYALWAKLLKEAVVEILK